MTDNVVSFSNRKDKSEIQELKETLKYCYQQIDDTYECLKEMEDSLEVIQNTYNQKLVDLATGSGGVDQITTDDLDYATNLHIENLGDGTLRVALNGVVAGSWEIQTNE